MIETIEKRFAPGYRQTIRDYIGHDFFDIHANRTREYAEILNFRDKKVLEVGGFPGLLVAMYLNNENHVETIESPTFKSESYIEWLNSEGIRYHVHDIVSGAPRIDTKYDVGVMSDVMLHIEGFPFEFWDWLLYSCKTVYLANYPDGSAKLIRATKHNLNEGFALPSHDEIVEISKAKSKLVQRKQVGGREFLVFERNND